MRLSMDPLNVETRSWLYYFVTQGVVPGACHYYLKWLGFEKGWSGTMIYHVRKSPRSRKKVVARRGSWAGSSSNFDGVVETTEDDEQTPIVFCHGLGVGILMYAMMLQELIRLFPERAIFLIDLPILSGKVQDTPLASPRETVACISDMLASHFPAFNMRPVDLRERLRFGLAESEEERVDEFDPVERSPGSSSRSPVSGSPGGGSSSGTRRVGDATAQSVANTERDWRGKAYGAHFVGHSFGTFVMSWVIRRRPDLVKFATFTDPVCFRLHSPDLT